MKLRWKITMIAVIASLLTVAILSTVGTRTVVDDVNNASDPTDSYYDDDTVITDEDTTNDDEVPEIPVDVVVPDDLPTNPLAYGTMRFVASVAYIGDSFNPSYPLAEYPFVGKFQLADIEVSDYIDLQTGMVYDSIKLNLLEFLLAEDNVVIFIRCIITGPNDFHEGWSSDGMKETLMTVGDSVDVSARSGRIFFWEAGEYRLSVVLSILALDDPTDDDAGFGISYPLATKIITFTVEG
jgi:hypothetical protein